MKTQKTVLRHLHTMKQVKPLKNSLLADTLKLDNFHTTESSGKHSNPGAVACLKAIR